MVLATRIEGNPFIDVPLSELSHKELATWYVWIQSEVGRRTAIRYFSFVKTFLSRAVAASLIPSNPASGIKDPPLAPVTKQILTAESVMDLIEHIQNLRLKKGVILCAHGLRPSEACGLKHEDIVGGIAKISRQLQDVGGRLNQRQPKSWNGIRDVPLNPDYLPLFKGQDVGWVLCGPRGRPYRPDDMRKDFRKALKGTRWENMKLYDLRSSFGSNLLMSGTDVRTAAEIMGHSPAMLAEIYARSKIAAKVVAVDSVWGTKKEKNGTGDKK